MMMPADAYVTGLLEAVAQLNARLTNLEMQVRRLEAQGMAARSAETSLARPEGQQPGPKDAP